MKIIKRNGSEETFDIQKIVVAVTKADKDKMCIRDRSHSGLTEYIPQIC